ncbi:hypothetical protein KVR01_003922 [Diaporthe batatas]|uniref:uncharacterized protein n=1 Tax=Diaporthe batatas TaxID=748121 RepID=UPI001D054C13|nr:uncharacterized protein KVR01_003922 [Diaporthe batatas]KAG8168233.1 hypothetical protein KVR01_003922 [Diaporthe batatas]
MATKRDIDSVDNTDGEDCQPQQPTKRTRNSSGQKKSKQSHEPQTDLTYGQRCCFPGLDHDCANSDEDLEFEDETDALAYLQNVRQQASSIPHLLVAPKSGPQLPTAPGSAARCDPYHDRDDETRGYYENGAYAAAPDIVDDGSPDGDESLGQGGHDEAARIAQAYYASLTTHFLKLRGRLHQQPPPEALAALTRDQSTCVGRFGPASRTFTTWSVRMRGADPVPAQVAAMDKDAVLRLLRVVLGGKFLRRGTELRERTSRWLWALLARLPDRGELDYMEVGHVRDLGKRAALLMHSLREMAALREEVEGGCGRASSEGDGLEGDQEDWDGEAEALDGDGRETSAHPQESAEQPLSVADDEPASVLPSSDLPAVPSSTAPAGAPCADIDEAEQMEDGEIDESAPMDIDPDVESAKTRLLAKLNNHGSNECVADQAGEEPPFDPARARMNMRATLNMILTVAGEIYGQRDLLEFRDPFQV